MSTKKRGLGRGLEALLGTGNKGAAPDLEAAPGDALHSLPIGDLQPGKYQPRTGMDPGKLAELAESIENIQREDLNPLEEAQALSRLIDEFSLTHQQAAEAVGRSRAAVSNLLRLLELPDGIRQLLEDKSLEMGHARALLTLAPAAALQLAKDAVAEGWSVREVERRAQLLAKGQLPAKKAGKAPAKRADADIAALERELSEKLGAKVAVQHGRGGRGKLVIAYHGLESLDGILERLRR